ncbi:MAG: hypothetical protein NZ519_12700 [Bacteroidia bacterium]|nr:hypothetical protein [Bacteroidia bacterium]
MGSFSDVKFIFGRALARVSLRSCGQGRRATGCASLRCCAPPAHPWARVKVRARGFAPSLTACPSHASRR